MTQIQSTISYIDIDGLPQKHVVRAEVDPDDFADDIREVTELVISEGFFLEMTEKRYVFIPKGRVTQVAFDLIDTEDGS